MRTTFFVVLMIALLAVPVMADTTQVIDQKGIGNSAYQIGDDAYISVRHADVKETNTQYNNANYQYTFEAPDQGPTTSYLGVGDVSYTRLVYPNRIALIPIPENVTEITVKSGTPIALYTISSDYVDIVHGSQATPDYNEFYDRMDHGTAKWESWIPYYTTSETIGIPETADYIVIDNRNPFTSYNLVEIVPHIVEEKESY